MIMRIMWRIPTDNCTCSVVRGETWRSRLSFLRKDFFVGRLLLGLVLVYSGLFLSGQASAEPLNLSLRDAVRQAAERNLDVRTELYNPAIFEAEVRRNSSIYDPLLLLQSQYADSSSPISGAGITNDSRSFFLDASLRQLIWTGGTAALVFNNSYLESRSTAPVRNYWESGLGVTFTQPLLKNAGRDATEVGIRVSRFNKFASLEQFNNRLMNTVAQVRIEYFRLYSLQEQLLVRKVSLELAQKILGDTKARVAAGVLPAMEILNAEFGVTAREKDLIDAEKGVRDQLDVLHQVLQTGRSDDIHISDPPRGELLTIDEAAAISRALDRPDIRSQKRLLDATEFQTKVLRTNTKPDLSLVLSGSLAGYDRTYDRNFERLAGFDYPAWSIGLNFTWPFGNNAALNDYRKSKLKTEQVALQIRNLEENATREVKAAIRAVNVGYKQIDVANRGRAYAEERLKAFIRKNEVGLATTKDVLDVENDLALAKNNQIAAQVNYINAITLYWQATGELLDQEGIRVVEGDADRLYSHVR